MPKMSNVVLSGSLRETARTINNTRSAPVMPPAAMTELKTSPDPAVLKPPASTTIATPKEAPEEMPMTDGPASGLRKSVCISSPLSASISPARIAVKARGRRVSITIRCCSSVPPPISAFQTSLRDRFTGPNASSRQNKTKAAIMSNRFFNQVEIAGENSVVSCRLPCQKCIEYAAFPPN